MLLSGIVVVILMLISVAFFIVTERKGLGMVQLRQGPNKVSVKGILQAVSDGVKLFKKEFSCPFSCEKEMFFLGPVVCFFCAYCLWILFPSSIDSLSFELGLLFFLCISSFSIYGIFITGWVCDSRYSFLGAMRAVAQSISYEVFMGTALFLPILFFSSFDLQVLRSGGFSSVLISQEIFLLWLISILAETNRAPFDFVEGESELVAGYSVEYGGVGFALIALAEYSNIMFMSMVSGVLFVGGLMSNLFLGSIMFSLWMVIISYFIVWVRGVVPRFRYDLLMSLCWVVLLPMSLCIFTVIVMMVL
uniref:NADH-ubiquinone oxidoreductase chain 1 n=1 Tax=Geloina coaxans TaxID=499929 RepID=A0A0R8SKT1_9BIVA|nr:NADH dehydrogenase subunit 1 [Geloina coaxans]